MSCLQHVCNPHVWAHCRRYVVLIACLQPSCTHMCGCIADDMRSARQRTKPWVWRETCSSSHMAFFLQLKFSCLLLQCQRLCLFTVKASWHTATDSQSRTFHDKIASYAFILSNAVSYASVLVFTLFELSIGQK